MSGYHFEVQGNLTDARAHESGESRSDWSSHPPHRGQCWKRTERGSEPMCAKLIGDDADRAAVELF